VFVSCSVSDLSLFPFMCLMIEMFGYPLLRLSVHTVRYLPLCLSVSTWRPNTILLYWLSHLNSNDRQKNTVPVTCDLYVICLTVKTLHSLCLHFWLHACNRRWFTLPAVWRHNRYALRLWNWPSMCPLKADKKQRQKNMWKVTAGRAVNVGNAFNCFQFHAWSRLLWVSRCFHNV
jgi:hypothetical protein